ncbi:MAG: precorrin-2 C(20)-methyltransferase [Bacteroidota bacterium]|nr:precorrin-2 C(20)-methyltransferase [Bacteroidota bacterium]
MSGKFYGIGVGPGDPELITMKAVNILKSVDVVAVPESSKEKGSVALDIARPYLREGAEMLTLTFPMIRDVAAKQRIREENAQKVLAEIQQGKTIAFLTLGDPMLYSTYIYLLENLLSLSIDIETIPGIYSFSAISNRLNMPLVKGDEKLAVISSLEKSDWSSLLAFDTVVCMKVSAYRETLAELLRLSDSPFDFVLVSNVGNIGNASEIVHQGTDVLEGEMPYFSTGILKRI